jgi:hypothetical protein
MIGTRSRPRYKARKVGEQTILELQRWLAGSRFKQKIRGVPVNTKGKEEHLLENSCRAGILWFLFSVSHVEIERMRLSAFI